MANKKINTQQDEEYYPFMKTAKTAMKLQKIVKKQKKQKHLFNFNKWTNDQNQKYSEYIKMNFQIFLSQQLRKSQKVYLKMSRFVKTRNCDQCRSHHQKMMKFHHTIEGILNNIEKRLLDHQQIELEVINLCQKKQIQRQIQNFDQKIEIQKVSNVSKMMGQQKIVEQAIWDLIDQQCWFNKE